MNLNDITTCTEQHPARFAITYFHLTESATPVHRSPWCRVRSRRHCQLSAAQCWAPPDPGSGWLLLQLIGLGLLKPETDVIAHDLQGIGGLTLALRLKLHRHGISRTL